ncbi:MAG TPA: hypothetical protein DDZ51_22265 [Planctomycetaceae bacterium]|nr:hypothetical protein [Planctomycetaceae bacterium]
MQFSFQNTIQKYQKIPGKLHFTQRASVPKHNALSFNPFYPTTNAKVGIIDTEVQSPGRDLRG